MLCAVLAWSCPMHCAHYGVKVAVLDGVPPLFLDQPQNKKVIGKFLLPLLK